MRETRDEHRRHLQLAVQQIETLKEAAKHDRATATAVKDSFLTHTDELERRLNS